MWYGSAITATAQPSAMHCWFMMLTATCCSINRDPIGYNGGINLYGYAGGNPIMRSDVSGYADVDLNTGEKIPPRQKVTKPKKKPRIAYIYVGNTSIFPGVDYFVNQRVWDDVCELNKFFEDRGYEVHWDLEATKESILTTLPHANAAAFIGHNGTPGQGVSFATADDEYIGPLDIGQAINNDDTMPIDKMEHFGRHLDYAIFHVCESNYKDLKMSTIGDGPGYFFAPTHNWNAMWNCEQKMGYKKLHYPKPY